MEAELAQKRMEHIKTLKDTFTTQDEEGNEHPFFCDKFLIIKYLKMRDADLELNEKFKIEQELAKKKSEEETNEEEESEDMNDFGDEEPESSENDEIDKEMMGDVQPEQPESSEETEEPAESEEPSEKPES